MGRKNKPYVFSGDTFIGIIYDPKDTPAGSNLLSGQIILPEELRKN